MGCFPRQFRLHVTEIKGRLEGSKGIHGDPRCSQGRTWASTVFGQFLTVGSSLSLLLDVTTKVDAVPESGSLLLFGVGFSELLVLRCFAEV